MPHECVHTIFPLEEHIMFGTFRHSKVFINLPNHITFLINIISKEFNCFSEKIQIIQKPSLGVILRHFIIEFLTLVSSI